ncbi:unnamed protein product [Orchesella dallaii]|uniref:Uncharacterized protein n=1 Tax=Orchesella dallaii TaxID=48710 RepID=A0ABP1PKQ3_9HEXA
MAQEQQSVLTPLIKTAALMYSRTLGLIPSFIYDLEICNSQLQIQWNFPKTLKQKLFALLYFLHIFLTTLGIFGTLAHKFIDPNHVELSILQIANGLIVLSSNCLILALAWDLTQCREIENLYNQLIGNQLSFQFSLRPEEFVLPGLLLMYLMIGGIKHSSFVHHIGKSGRLHWGLRTNY